MSSSCHVVSVVPLIHEIYILLFSLSKDVFFLLTDSGNSKSDTGALTHTILRYAWCVPGLPFGGTHHAYLKRLAVGIFDIPTERSPCDLIDCSKKAAIDKIRGHII